MYFFINVNINCHTNSFQDCINFVPNPYQAVQCVECSPRWQCIFGVESYPTSLLEKSTSFDVACVFCTSLFFSSSGSECSPLFTLDRHRINPLNHYFENKMNNTSINAISYSWFHIKGTWSVHLFKGGNLSISEGTGSCGYLFHEIPGTSKY